MKRLPIIIMLITALLNLTIGCSTDDKALTSSDQTSTLEGAAQRSFEVTECQTGQIIHVSSLNLSIDTEMLPDIELSLANGEIQATIEKFSDMYYSLDLANSFVMEGIGVPEGTTDSVSVKIINLIMRYDPDSLHSLIWISQISSPGRDDLYSYIQTSQWNFVIPEENSSDFEMIHLGTNDEGHECFVWIKDHISPYSPKGDASTALWSWKSWGKCVAITAVAGCVGSVTKCLITGPAYAQCMAAGCGGSVAAGVVGCALKEWFF